MRASLLVCGSFVAAALLAGACGDDAARRSAQGESGAGGAGEGVAANASGGSESEPGGGGADPAGGANPTMGGSVGAGGSDECLIGPEEGQPDDYLREFQSGTRLQARYYAAAGMPDVFAGFFDTELDEWCDFMLASDDTLRCLPRSTANTGHLGYADALCQNSVWTLSPGCATAAQPRVRRQLECADKAEVRLLEPYSGVPFVGNADQCISSDIDAPADAYTLGAELPPESFVAGTLVDLPGVCRASLRVVDSADGARGPMHVFDIASGIACTPVVAGCRPLKLAYEDPTLRSDDACETEPDQGYATWTNAETCAPPELVRPASGEIDGWYRAGELSDAELYAATDSCKPAREMPWIGAIYELGEVVPTASLAALAAQPQGTGALQIGANSENGRPLIALLDGNVRFHHSALDVDCNLRKLADGTLRCIPSEVVVPAGIYDEFNDPDCSEPTRRCQGDACAEKLIFDEEVATEVCSSERPTTAIWRLKTQATAYYRESPGFPCYAAGSVQPDMWTAEEVDPSELPEASLETAD